MVFRHLDPVRDAEAYYEARRMEYERKLQSMPYCTECGEQIRTERFYIIGDEYICPDCMDKHIVYTDDYLEDL